MRYQALDSLRGLAALTVCWLHYYLINQQVDLLGANAKPWLWWTAGQEAVILFFILSGFVLSNMMNFHYDSYTKYVIKRVFRLYPAYYVAMIVAISIFFIQQPYLLNTCSRWFAEYLSVKINALYWINTILLFTKSFNLLNNVIWSTSIELLVSFFFPLLFFTMTKALRQQYAYVYLIMIYIMIVACTLTGKTLFYNMQFFMIGILMFIYKNRLRCLCTNTIFACGVFCYFNKFFTFGMLQSIYAHNEVSAIGVIIIIANALHCNYFKQFLSHPILVFYGTISYSFYLLHMPICFALIYSLYIHGINLFLTKVLAFIAASILAYASYRYIELPCMKYAKKLTLNL
jgi:peptidoglycan/LPS O-acetylase OafA/YrhL